MLIRSSEIAIQKIGKAKEHKNKRKHCIVGKKIKREQENNKPRHYEGRQYKPAQGQKRGNIDAKRIIHEYPKMLLFSLIIARKDKKIKLYSLSEGAIPIKSDQKRTSIVHLLFFLLLYLIIFYL